MSILQTTNLCKTYGQKPNIVKALDGVTITVDKGEFVAIIGTSGSGKSTLLVLSRIMRKLVCRLWLDEVSRQ